jgi:hypothetical protein
MTETALDLVSDNLTGLGAWLDGMAEVIQDFDDTETLVVRAMLDDLLAALRGAIGATDNRLVELIPVGETLTKAGVGSVVIEAKGKQTTHGARLARRLAARIADTPADSDGVALPPAVLCEKTADELVEVFGLDVPSATFRSTAVKGRGMRPGEFREFADGTPRARFIR